MGKGLPWVHKFLSANAAFSVTDAISSCLLRGDWRGRGKLPNPSASGGRGLMQGNLKDKQMLKRRGQTLCFFPEQIEEGAKKVISCPSRLPVKFRRLSGANKEVHNGKANDAWEKKAQKSHLGSSSRERKPGRQRGSRTPGTAGVRF